MRFWKVLFLFTSIVKADSFLSNDEYAKMLFKNPRGIACSVCHGQRGEGGVLTTYTIEIDGKKVVQTVEAPRINDLGVKEFIKAFEKKKRYMPRYYLTDKELAYIYFYLTKQRKIYEDQKK